MLTITVSTLHGTLQKTLNLLTKIIIAIIIIIIQSLIDAETILNRGDHCREYLTTEIMWGLKVINSTSVEMFICGTRTIGSTFTSS